MRPWNPLIHSNASEASMAKSAYLDVAVAFQLTPDNHRIKFKVLLQQKIRKVEVMINFYQPKEMRSNDDFNTVIALKSFVKIYCLKN